MERYEHDFALVAVVLFTGRVISALVDGRYEQYKTTCVVMVFSYEVGKPTLGGSLQLLNRKYSATQERL